jgi:hypothetical protein
VRLASMLGQGMGSKFPACYAPESGGTPGGTACFSGGTAEERWTPQRPFSMHGNDFVLYNTQRHCKAIMICLYACLVLC